MDTILKALSDLKAYLETLEETEIGEQSSALIDHILYILNESENDLLSQHLLRKIQPSINAASAHKENLNTVVTNLVNVIAIIPLPLNKMRPKSESVKVIDALKQNIAQADVELEQSKNGFVIEIDALKEEIKGLELLLESSTAKLDKQATRLDGLVESSQLSFDTKRTEISTKNDNFLTSVKAEVDKEVSAEKIKIKELIDSQNDIIESQSSKAEAHIRKLQELLGLAGDDTMTVGYSRSALEKGKASLTWSVLAMLFFVLSLIISVLVVLKYKFPHEISITELAARITFSLSALIPAVYCASKAARHRKSQLRLRSAGIRLATLEPFLSKFPDDSRAEIRKNLLDEFFRHKDEVIDRRPIIGIGGKKLVEIIKEVKS